MEVMSIMTSDANLTKLFDEFILGYYKLKEKSRDNDTIYYSRVNSEVFEIYYHYELNNIFEEFAYNYTEEDKSRVKEYFGDKELYIFDISFKDVFFKSELLKDFSVFLKEKEKEAILKDALISDPFDGISKFISPSE